MGTNGRGLEKTLGRLPHPWSFKMLMSQEEGTLEAVTGQGLPEATQKPTVTREETVEDQTAGDVGPWDYSRDTL